MRSSSAILVVAALLAMGGCAAAVRRGEAPAPAPGEPAGAGSHAPAAKPATPGEGEEPSNRPASPERAGPEGPHDPSEEITAEELASIPDPVPQASRSPGAPPGTLPGSGVAPEGSSSPPAEIAAPEGPEAPSGGSETGAGAAESGWAWQVQIYASERLEEAERVASEAGARLGAPAAVVREGTLHKVRLGRFATEAEAQSLRERAVEAGYHGAFRIRAR